MRGPFAQIHHQLTEIERIHKPDFKIDFKNCLNRLITVCLNMIFLNTLFVELF